MAGITAGGIGSGLDVESIMSQLMMLERSNLNRIDAREKSYQAELSAYGRVKSAVSTFESAMYGLESASKFSAYTTTSGNEDVFTATASSSASKGSYSITVNNLAEAHKLRTGTAVASADTFSSGSLDISLADGSAFSVAVGAGDTLTQIRDAVNSAADNPGVTASIIDDGTGNQYLTLTADETGTDSAISIAVSGETLGSGTHNLSDFFVFDAANPAAPGNTLVQQQAAENADLTIDGIGVTSQSNSVEGAIAGVTIELKQESATATSLSVTTDVEKIKESVQAFVDAYNELHKTLKGLRKEGGDLQGDATIRNIESRISSVLNTSPAGLTGSFSYLAEIGISRDRNGVMSLDSSALEDAVAQDLNGVVELFTLDNEGFAARLQAYAKDVSEFDGLLDGKMDGINDRIDALDNQRDREEYRLELIERRYRAQFTQLDSLMGQMQSTSSYLNSQLSQL